MPMLDGRMIFYGIVFLAVLLLVEGGYFLIRDSRSGKSGINRRLRMIAEGGDQRALLAQLRRDADRSFVGRLLPGVDRQLREAGMTVSTARFVLIMLACMVMATAAVRLGLRLPLSGAVVSGALFGAAGPLLVVRAVRQKRLSRFLEQLPEGLEMMIRSLRAGHPVSAALTMLAREMPDPIGTEFGIVVDEMTYGLDLDAALANMARRVPVSDLQYMVVTVQIQRTTGGNLAEVLSNLATVLRARFAMKDKIRAISAEGRGTAILMGALPIVVPLLIHVLRPEYYGEAAQDPKFPVILGIAAALMIVGQVIMFKLVRFKF